MNCTQCGSSRVYDHEEELGVTSDCQNCGHWTFKKYDWVDETRLGTDECQCDYCQEDGQP